MLNIISTIPPSLQRFLGNFKDLFIKPQFKNFKVYPLGLQLEVKRTNIQTIPSRIKRLFITLAGAGKQKILTETLRTI